MKQSPDTPKKRLIHWHWIKWQFFCYYCRLSSAQLDRWQSPTQRPIIDQNPVKQTAYRRKIKDNGYKSVFTNCSLVRQRNMSWIKEWTRSLLAVPFVRGYRTVNPRTPRNDCVYTSQAPRQGSQNTQKSECAFRRSPIGRSPKNVNWSRTLCFWACANNDLLKTIKQMIFIHILSACKWISIKYVIV